LGMWVEGIKEFPDEAPPHARTFIKIVIISTSSFILQEGMASLNGRAPALPELDWNLPGRRPSRSSRGHAEGPKSPKGFVR
jgi:hypothetical protein